MAQHSGETANASSPAIQRTAFISYFHSAIKRLRLDHTVDREFSLDDLAALSKASPHALRHTFGTLAVADGMPIDVAQAVLGHKDSATTVIYVQAKTKRVVEEGAKYFAKKSAKSPPRAV